MLFLDCYLKSDIILSLSTDILPIVYLLLLVGILLKNVVMMIMMMMWVLVLGFFIFLSAVSPGSP